MIDEAKLQQDMAYILECHQARGKGLRDFFECTCESAGSETAKELAEHQAEMVMSVVRRHLKAAQ